MENAIRGATNSVIAAEPRITDYDTVLGDGDCGQTLKTAALGKLYILNNKPNVADSYIISYPGGDPIL